jgi:hypothetical protein
MNLDPDLPGRRAGGGHPGNGKMGHRGQAAPTRGERQPGGRLLAREGHQ